ncbi:MAG: CDP-diacylglycerol--serine O-phosphatidyltransferase [Gammaproteobacteria bacterium]|nr:CDP-diacylglycerol--serine O-phosphatidyltransferase [Gammaproteobacteria bacterium]
MDENETPKRRRRGIYLLPNLFTTATLFGGFYAIVAAMGGDFENAAYGILAAMVADGLDGRIARLTNTASDFGKEYDSLSDMVAFGLAASLVVYSFSLHYLSSFRWLGGKLGWVIAFGYAACAALRLARFNVLAWRGGAKGSFFGLPSPAAAAVAVGFVWAMDSLGFKGRDVLVPAMLITAGAAVLMVSNIRFESFKQVKLTERVPFRYIALVVGVFALFLVHPPLIFFLVFFGYALSGPIAALYRRMKKPAPTATPPPKTLTTL